SSPIEPSLEIRLGVGNRRFMDNINSMRHLLLLMALLACAKTFAATDSMPASSNLGGAEYPRVASDLRVTFRLKAPNAKQVKLEGGAGLVKEPLELARGEDGTWTVTT